MILGKTKSLTYQRRATVLPSQSLQVLNELTDDNQVLILPLEGLGSPGGYEFLLSFTGSKETKTERQMFD